MRVNRRLRICFSPGSGTSRPSRGVQEREEAGRDGDVLSS